jgi:hypothetical protein
MTWARLDDNFYDHPKVLDLLEEDDGVAAVGLWTLALSWAHRHLRSAGRQAGRIPDHLPRRLVGAVGSRLAALLVKVGLWEQDSNGWQIHDLPSYLPSSELSAKRAAAGRKGAEARWRKQKSAGESVAEPVQPPVQDHVVPMPDSNLPSFAMATPGSGRGYTPTRPEPLKPEGEREPQTSSLSPSPQDFGKSVSRAPDDYVWRPPVTVSGTALLDQHIGCYPARPPRDVIRRTGEVIDRLLGEGISPGVVQEALKLLRQRPGSSPGFLPYLVHQVQQGAGATAIGTAHDRANNAIDAARRVREMQTRRELR